MKKLVAALVFGSCAFAATSLFADYGYYDDGHLLAHWDAIDNQATGEHVDGTTWVDLKTGGEFVLNGATWGDKFLQFAGNNASYAKLTNETVLAYMYFPGEAALRTIEIAYAYNAETGKGLLFCGPSSSQPAIGRWNDTYSLSFNVRKQMPATQDAAFHTVSVGYRNNDLATDEDARYEDGVAKELLTTTDTWNNSDAAMYLGRGKTQYASQAKIYSVRIYDCFLTPEQAAQNREADLDRFARVPGAVVVSGTVTVEGRTYAAGETVRIREGSAALEVESASAAELRLLPEARNLVIASGSAALVSDGASVRIDNLTLGAGAVLKLPADGLTVLDAIAGDATAAVAGPGELVGLPAESPVALTDGATYRPLIPFVKYGYVTKGLIACWDAVDNGGDGVHDPYATTWKDLVGGLEFQLTGTTWGERHLYFAGAKKAYGMMSGDAALAIFARTAESPDRTVELVFQYDESNTDGLVLQAQTASNIAIGRWYTGGGQRTMYTNGSGPTESTMPGTEFYTISASYRNGALQVGNTYQQNVAVPLSKGKNYWETSTETDIALGRGANSLISYSFKGRIYGVRVYDRQLTEAEVTQNYNADQNRYYLTVRATVLSGSVTVGETTYTAGQVLKTAPDVTALALDSAADAVLALEPDVTALTLTAGTCKLVDSATGGVTFLSDLSLGAAATLRLPVDGLCVMDGLTAEEGAAVSGPGTLIARPATCPAALTGGAKYVSSTAAFVWPDSGIAYVPADVTAPVLADDIAKIAGLDKIVFLGVTSKAVYALPDAWTFNVPVEGPGTFAFESAGDISLGGDNRNLSGSFFFTNTTVLVTHENGLGSSGAQTCHFWCGDTTEEMPYGHTIDFDNGESVFTNRVAVHLHPLPTKSIVFGAVSSDKTLVQDADFWFSRCNATDSDKIYPRIKGPVKFLRHFEYLPGEWTQYPYMNVSGDGSVWLLGDLRMKSTGNWFVDNGTWHLGCRSVDATLSMVVYSPVRIICEAENVLGGMTLKPYQQKSLFDLNGHGQDCVNFRAYDNPGDLTTGDPIIRFTSATPAAFRVTGEEDHNLNPTFTGAAGFTMAGTGTYGLYGTGGRDTTGELKVEKGTLNLATDFSWGGTNVTVQGGTLVIAADAATKATTGEGAVFSRKAILQVSGTGAVDIAAGRTETVRCYSIDGVWQPKGDYTLGSGTLRVRCDSPEPEGILILVR